VHPADREQDRERGEDGEAEVVHPHAPEHVAEPAEADDEHGGHDEEAEDQPEQVARVARLQRVEADAAEDVGERDQDDRLVDRHHQHAERRVREGDPLVFGREPGHEPVSYVNVRLFRGGRANGRMRR
jgi:hypothetical protein